MKAHYHSRSQTLPSLPFHLPLLTNTHTHTLSTTHGNALLSETRHSAPRSVSDIMWSVCYGWMLFLGIFHLQAFCCLWSLSRWKEWAEQDLSMVLNYFQLNSCPQATATRNMHQQYETVLCMLQQHCPDTESWHWPNSLQNITVDVRETARVTYSVCVGEVNGAACEGNAIITRWFVTCNAKPTFLS